MSRPVRRTFVAGLAMAGFLLATAGAARANVVVSPSTVGAGTVAIGARNAADGKRRDLRRTGLALLRPDLEQRQILFGKIGGRAVWIDAARVLPVGAGTIRIARSLAQDSPFQQRIGILGVEVQSL